MYSMSIDYATKSKNLHKVLLFDKNYFLGQNNEATRMVLMLVRASSSCLSNADSINCDYVAKVRLRLVHLVVHSHLVGLIVHGLARYLIVDVLRPEAVVVA